ncbi:YccT family protein [Grimontia sp. NTOU-MAR1]|uniref:YccT family protein n=1 Tax=Grimontia sp. NTOU-MAR1 TaxID=3111011 RepID=UPI002DB66FC4|nr:DUF2057 family protein [Grimontia sp. NTOU-MAR1]WRV97407.1 DUF2057 family protein [Grimontia sp. NTOU-MAR1]
MNSFFPILAFVVALLPLNSLASVNVELDRNVAQLVVNGEQTGIFLNKQSKLELENGVNQLVIRVEKLVQSSNGEREKFNSKPVVLTFNAANSSLELTVDEKIDTTNQAREFDRAPKFIVREKNTGRVISNEQALLPSGGGITRDYEREVERYNKKNNIILEESAVFLDEMSEEGMKLNQTKTINSNYSSNDNRMIIMQADFLRMSAEEQKKFLKWAVENTRT